MKTDCTGMGALRGAFTVLLLLFLGTAAHAASNSLTIREAAGVTTANYPIQIGRPFVDGEIAGSPQALINGVAVPTQADVKTRWSSGSVKHAILSFLIPNLAANTSITVTFQDQGSGNSTPLTKAQMLDPVYDFEAQMVFTGGVNATASARQVLNDWNGSTNSDLGPVKLWTQGPIATTVILADHSTSRVYDVGSDSHRSLRPIFHATFWPGINKVRVRYIGENSNTIALQDQAYSLALKLGLANPQTIYSKANIVHWIASRWTKEFWIGGAPPAIDIDNNLAYLVQTTAIPNYDTSKVIPASEVDCDYVSCWYAWSNTPRDLFDPGQWTKRMATSGGRPEIGPYPKWTVQWLYTGDRRSREMALSQSDLAAAWPMHLREGDASKTFDTTGGLSALGRPISIAAHPTIQLYGDDYTYSYTTAADKITPIGPYTRGGDPSTGWATDGAHQPSAFFPEYLLTGDYWYLEEQQMWAAYSAARYNAGGIDYNGNAAVGGRGPTGKEGGIQDEVRGDGWVFRNRVETAFISPDGTPEKNYFTRLATDAIARWEGLRDITGTALQGTPVWAWAHSSNQQPTSMWRMNNQYIGTAPLHNWEVPNLSPDPTAIDTTKVTGVTAQWMEDWLIYGLGRGRDLGFPTDALIAWVGQHLIQQIVDPATGQVPNPSYDPYYIIAYRTPTTNLTGWITTWTEVKAGYLPWNAQGAFNSDKTQTEQGYSQSAVPALSFLAQEPGGAAAWTWINQQVVSQAVNNKDPKWCIVPRTPVAPPSNSVPAITRDPSSISIAAGNPAIFTVYASGYPYPAFQWQSKAPGAVNFTDIAGATQGTYTIGNPTLAMTGSQYRALAMNSVGASPYSAAATLTVTVPPAPGTPPTLTNGQPSGSVAVGPTVLSVNTNISATCRYAASANTAYSAMPNTFSTTGSTLHQQTITVLNNQTYRYYVRCDAGGGGVNAFDFPIAFGAGTGGNPGPVNAGIGSGLNVQIYPNPWRSDRHASQPGMTFAGLMPGTTIKIFTAGGHEVKELKTDSPTLTWNLKNENGDKVASGIYLYLIKDAAGNKARGKIAVIK